MSNFKYPIRVDNITKEQCNEIIPLLKELGYKHRIQTSIDKTCTVLVTNDSQLHDGLYVYKPSKVSSTTIRTTIPYNKDLILALAAVREGNEFHEGEIVVPLKEDSCPLSHGGYKTGELYKIYELDKSYVKTYNIKNVKWGNGWANTNFRKATKEEIIDYFTSSSQHKPEGMTKEWLVKTNSTAQREEIFNYINSLTQFNHSDDTSYLKIYFNEQTFECKYSPNIAEIGKDITPISFEEWRELTKGRFRPVKWAVKISDYYSQNKAIESYILSKNITFDNVDIDEDYDYYIFDEKTNRYSFSEGEPPSSYTILTYQEWEKQILNKSFINNQKPVKNGTTEKGVEVPAITPTISRGQKITGNSVSGEACRATIAVGHISNRAVYYGG